MANANKSMTVNVGANTSDFTKKMKAAQGDLRAFENASDNALGKLGEAFGVNTHAITQLGETVRGLGLQMQTASNTGVQAFGKLLTGITPLKAGLAGLGIGAVVAGFKALVAEAENFKTTVAGANIELATTAYIDTYRQVIHDFNAETGKAVAQTQSGWKKFWGTAGATMRAAFSTGAIVPNPMGASSPQMENFLEVTDRAAAKALEASEIANQIYETQRKISDESRLTAQLDAVIAENRLIVNDSTKSVAERQAALNNAIELTYVKYQGITEETQHWASRLGEAFSGYQGVYNLNVKLADLMDQMNATAASTPEQIDAANAQSVRAISLMAQQDSFLRELMEKRKTLGDLAAKEAQEQQAIAAAAAATAQAASLMRGKASISDIDSSGLTGSAITGAGSGLVGLTVPVRVTMDQQGWQDFSRDAEQLTTGLISSMSDAIGGLVGDLLTGGNAWENFGQTALGTLADIAQQAGKIAVATGTAMLGIKQALKLGDPWVAIGAGVALIALGAAVKAGLSNAAAGGSASYAAASAGAVASSGYSAATSVMGDATRDIRVSVSGTLRASGNELVAVLNNENKRLKHTT